MVTHQAIERLLRTGSSDPYQRTKSDVEQLRTGLLAEVLNRASSRVRAPVPDLDLVAFTRQKVSPMVRGLFPRAEQPAVLQSLADQLGNRPDLVFEEVAEIVREASQARNGWKVILAHCSDR